MLKKDSERLPPVLFSGQQVLNCLIFKEVLINPALLTNWEDLILPIAEADKTPECFEVVLQQL
jgi:hypothetical protein